VAATKIKTLLKVPQDPSIAGRVDGRFAIRRVDGEREVADEMRVRL
jgi:hypothetical protein